ncbi:MAG TPA: hypothetical protein VF178_03790, partial [Gemmatimonadaceae bacterium]
MGSTGRRLLWGTVAAALIVTGAGEFGVLSSRYVLALAVVTLAAVAASVWPRIRAFPHRPLALSAFALPLLLQAAAWGMVPEIGLYDIAFRAGQLLFGWGVAVAILRCLAESPPQPSPPGRAPHPAWALGLLLVAVAGLTVIHWVVVLGRPLVIDEAHYVLQSRLLAEPGFTRSLDPQLAPFFLMRQAYLRDGHLNGQYPPGWPVLLALFDRAHLMWAAGIALATLSGVFTYLLGRDLGQDGHDPWTGLIAALLLVTNYQFLGVTPTYFPHAATLACCTGAAWSWLRATRSPPGGGRALAWHVAAGFALGVAMAVRPYTGAVAAVALTIWFWPPPWHLRRLIVPALGLLLGMAPAITGLLFYNAVTNGHPLVFGYAAAQGALHDLGFGLRGLIVYDPQGHALHRALLFTPWDGAVATVLLARRAIVRFSPFGLVVPLLVLGRSLGAAIRWRLVIAVLTLPLAYAFWYYAHLRFWVELLPFVALVAARLLGVLRRRTPAIAVPAVTLLVAGGLLQSLIVLRHEYQENRREFGASFAAIDAAARAHPLLVFVSDPRSEPALLEALQCYNAGPFPGRVVVARDLGPAR